MDDPNITMEEYIRLEEEKAHRRGKVYNWETATYGKIWDNEDVHDLGSIKTEFPAIVFNETLTSEATLSCEPTVSSLNNEIDFRISLDESDDEDYTECKAQIRIRICINCTSLKQAQSSRQHGCHIGVIPLCPNIDPTAQQLSSSMIVKVNEMVQRLTEAWLDAQMRLVRRG
ncbi:hypothetical protein Tco_1317051 [Tanacetum coccineum]